MSICSESIFIPINETDTLHLKRIFKEGNKKPCFLLHGAIENGRIFYSKSGKGFAYYLAENGFDVFVADLRGRGKSTPNISEESNFGQTDIILEDINAFVSEIKCRYPDEKQVWVAHSWGGVLLSSYISRHPECLKDIKCSIYFGSKRSVRVKNLRRLFYVSFAWNWLAPKLIKKYGFLPAVKYKMGSDNESYQTLLDSVNWVKSDHWIDPKDEFDYKEALHTVSLPKTLYLIGKKDHSLGHKKDVLNFISESGNHVYDVWMLSKKDGFLQNYGHIDMLTHKDSVKDHFPKVIDWIESV